MSPPSREPQTSGGGFRLLRFYTLATMGLFVAAAGAMIYLQHREEVYFAKVQAEQQAFVARAQSELAQRHEAAARASLLAVHEAAHVTLTRVVANLLWDVDIAPFVARAQQVSVQACRELPRAAQPNQKTPDIAACLAKVGERIRALPGFANLDRKAYEAMRTTKVFKIKVWDLRGVTVYSSEHAQVGDDGAANRGWREARDGRPASELTHRERFSAFEGVVENRDLISTYVPLHDDQDGTVVGVFELYSDVTAFLEEIGAASARFKTITDANDQQLREASNGHVRSVSDNSVGFILTVGGLIGLLYGASILIVRIGQRIIDRQWRAQQEAARREQQWHGEKMAALSAMAANVAHEVGNPLAVISGAAQLLPPPAQTPPHGGIDPATMILEQTDRVARMVRQIADFASAERTERTWLDLNPVLEALCAFHGFDPRFRHLPVTFTAQPGLPACELVPDHLNELMMAVLQGFAERAALSGPRQIRVESLLRGDRIVIRCTLEPAQPVDGRVVAAAELRLRRLAQRLGADLVIDGDRIEVVFAPSPG